MDYSKVLLKISQMKESGPNDTTASFVTKDDTPGTPREMDVTLHLQRAQRRNVLALSVFGLNKSKKLTVL
jgi:hypothetical protein